MEFSNHSQQGGSYVSHLRRGITQQITQHAAESFGLASMDPRLGGMTLASQTVGGEEQCCQASARLQHWQETQTPTDEEDLKLTGMTQIPTRVKGEGGGAQAFGVPSIVPETSVPPQPEQQEEHPLYVNAKQFHRILKRRAARQRLGEKSPLSTGRKPYLHESRHNHAKRRLRGPKGRFLTAEEVKALEEQKGAVAEGASKKVKANPKGK